VLSEVQALLDTAIGIDPVVYSQFYRVLSIFHKVSCFVLFMDDSHEFWCVAGPHVGLIARLLSFLSLLSLSIRLLQNQSHAGEFYKAGLLYLAFTPLDTLSLEVKRGLARDLGIAGLVAGSCLIVTRILMNLIDRWLQIC
jgi:hypothetical protein